MTELICKETVILQKKIQRQLELTKNIFLN